MATFIPTLGDDVFNGIDGVSDKVDYSAASAADGGIHVNLGAAGPQNTVGSGMDTFISVDTLIGTSFDDTVRISAMGSYNLALGNGNDVLESVVTGGTWILNGGAGYDIWRADSVSTSPVNLVFNGTTGQGSLGNITLKGIEQIEVSLSSGDDNVNLTDPYNSWLQGGDGSDTFTITGFHGLDNRIDAGGLSDSNNPEIDTLNLTVTGNYLYGLSVSFDANYDTYMIGASNDGGRIDIYAFEVVNMVLNDEDSSVFVNDVSPTSSRSLHIDGKGGVDTLQIQIGHVSNIVFTMIDGVTVESNIGQFDNFENVDIRLAAGVNKVILGDGNDTISAINGYDTVHAGGGNDYFEGNGALGETVYGEAGQDALHGSQHQDFLYGGDDADKLFGANGADLLDGGTGNDLLDGGEGADIMSGGLGDDIYYIDNAGDTITELSGGGVDRVYASLNYVLGANLENLFLTDWNNINASGNALNNLIIGNGGNNTINGGTGADTLNGGLGNDTYIVDNAGDIIIEGNGGGTDTVYASLSYSLTGSYLENLFLTGTANINATGNAGNNTLVGNSGNNVFNGGAGADSMNGGAGNDLYYVDNAGDVIIEGNGGGTDSVYAGISYSLTGSYLENLFLTGAANINATGNAGDNTLVGNSGNNVFNGGAGADTMNGGLGNDTYYVDNAGDVVVEGNGGGTDTVISSISYSLSGSYVENLTLTGSANINLTGNGLANILTGNTGNNIFNGGAGNDILTGGGGNDIFWFGAGSGHDTISDFSADTINLNAYSHGVTNGGGIVISQVGGNTTIDLGGGNIITLTGVAPADLNGHIVW